MLRTHEPGDEVKPPDVAVVQVWSTGGYYWLYERIKETPAEEEEAEEEEAEARVSRVSVFTVELSTAPPTSSPQVSRRVLRANVKLTFFCIPMLMSVETSIAKQRQAGGGVGVPWSGLRKRGRGFAKGLLDQDLGHEARGTEVTRSLGYCNVIEQKQARLVQKGPVVCGDIATGAFCTMKRNAEEYCNVALKSGKYLTWLALMPAMMMMMMMMGRRAARGSGYPLTDIRED
ncbi:hypothetical protein EYF80_046101 [Liparis tanakae]|uniref:Uncharacterized protein n=1 Tax=Liparis tanakae TaxID=230148 RepID=A0A4Z2FR41_9TELE|nr:hypothetical protein EYF80_046101 [Liparis tanakae]